LGYPELDETDFSAAHRCPAHHRSRTFLEKKRILKDNAHSFTDERESTNEEEALHHEEPR
jgi:hypothetical protein